ncbi:hypothetical protein BSLG_001164 [Batrachochytrium salamandrivorans]|nr:hypothetical protein BSLG_001164 [Batrachochytrium salamandrivorans]
MQPVASTRPINGGGCTAAAIAAAVAATAQSNSAAPDSRKQLQHQPQQKTLTKNHQHPPALTNIALPPPLLDMREAPIANANTTMNVPPLSTAVAAATTATTTTTTTSNRKKRRKAATSNKNGATVGCQTVLSNINAKAILHPPALPVINGMNHTDFGNILNHTNPTLGKKKKGKGHAAVAVDHNNRHHHFNHHHHHHHNNNNNVGNTTVGVIAAKPDDIWYVGDAAERLRLRDFWLQLSEEDRSALVKLEKEAVLKKVRDQQKQTCSCHVCGRRRKYKQTTSARVSYHRHIDDVMADIDDEDCDDESDSSGILEFGTSLTVKGGILTVADDFLKNDGQKFLNLMEQLSQRRLQSTNDDEDDFAPTGNNERHGDHLTEQQRMEEGRRMFQIFAAKMFEQRVLAAYHEKLSQERQERLIEELEAEEREILHKEKAKQESKEKKRAQKRGKARLEEEQRCALELELERKAEEERQRLVAEQIKREAELKAQQMAEDKARRDAEKARKNESAGSRRR